MIKINTKNGTLKGSDQSSAGLWSHAITSSEQDLPWFLRSIGQVSLQAHGLTRRSGCGSLPGGMFAPYCSGAPPAGMKCPKAQAQEAKGFVRGRLALCKAHQSLHPPTPPLLCVSASVSKLPLSLWGMLDQVSTLMI